MTVERARDTSRKGLQLITFRLGAEYYAIRVSEVREILRPLDLYPVPGMGNSIEGVINLRGEIIPIVKLFALLGIECAASGDASRKRRMIIVEASCGSFGFFVDDVLEVTRIQVEDLQAPPDLGRRAAGAGAVTGIVKVSGRMVVCIAPDKLITDDLMAKEPAIGQ
jgi:chemotaxis signal transduction protein